MDVVTAPVPVRVYWQRWWILAVFSVLTMWNCSIWNTFGPMASTAKRVSNLEIGTESETLLFVMLRQIFGWSDATLTQFTLWVVICFPIFFLPSAWLLARSLRCSVLFCALCTFLASTIR